MLAELRKRKALFSAFLFVLLGLEVFLFKVSRIYSFSTLLALLGGAGLALIWVNLLNRFLTSITFHKKNLFLLLLSLPALMLWVLPIGQVVIPRFASELPYLPQGPHGIGKYLTNLSWIGWLWGSAFVGLLVILRAKEDSSLLRDKKKMIRYATVGILSFTLLAGLSIRQDTISNDELIYVTMGYSILQDKDIVINNNLLQHDFARWFSMSIPPERMVAGTGLLSYLEQNRPYMPIHPYAVSLLLALVLVPFRLLPALPPYVTRTIAGGVFTLSMGLSFIYSLRVLLNLRYSPRRSLITIGLLLIGTPMLLWGYTVTPEPIGIFLSAYCLFYVTASKEERKNIKTGGFLAALAGLVLLHLRMIPLAFAFAVMEFWREKEQTSFRDALSSRKTYFTTGVIFFVFMLRMILTRTISGFPFGGYETAIVTNQRNLPFQMLGYFYSSAYGLFPYMPLSFLIFAGWYRLLSSREKSFPNQGWMMITLIGLWAMASFHVAWNSGSGVGRYLSPALPFLAVGLAALIPLILRRGGLGPWIARGIVVLGFYSSFAYLAAPVIFLQQNHMDFWFRLPIPWLEEVLPYILPAIGMRWDGTPIQPAVNLDYLRLQCLFWLTATYLLFRRFKFWADRIESKESGGF